MRIDHQSLKRLVAAIFSATGSFDYESDRIAHYLVEANLVGHDSHGVIRVPAYVEFVKAVKVVPNQTLEVVFENECVAVVDGRFGFGQVMGEQAMRLAIDQSDRFGVAVVALRNCGHLGRIGDWGLMAADENKLALIYVNTSGAGLLVAPYGGIDRRLSANPIVAAVPVPDRRPILLDISASSIAEGKIKVAYNKGVNVADGCLIDSQGLPSCDPKTFYGSPPGAILSFGGHKGYGLGIIVEMLAGALTGNGCTQPGVPRLSNGMLAIVLDPERFRPRDEWSADIHRFIDFVKSSRTVAPGGEILMPGELEDRTKERRAREGIELDEVTWGQIVKAADSVGVAVP